MSGRVRVEPILYHRDTRGLVLEPLKPDAILAQRNFHLVVTEPGCVRGNHYHPRGTEIAIVLGPALVRLRESGEIRDVPVPEGQAYRLTIPSGVSHAFQNTGARPNFLAAFNTVVYDPTDPDVVRDVLIAD